jgi:putative salt-induced outer membrane protein YdiY
MLSLSVLIPCAVAGMHAPGDWQPFGRPESYGQLSVISLDEQEVFARREVTRGYQVVRPESELSAELGGNTSMGNVGTSVLYARFQAGYRWGWNRLGMDGLALYGQAMVDANGDGMLDETERSSGFERNAQRFVTDGRYDRYLNPVNSVYLMAGWMNNPFSGYERRLHGQSGYSRFLVATDSHELVGETGFDVAHERYVIDVDPREDWVYAGRGFLSWTTSVDELIQVGNSFESFVNVEAPEDVRLIGEVSLLLRASNVLSVKTTYLVEHETTPIEGFRPTDQMMALTLVGSLFGQLPEPVGPPVP